MSQAIEQSAQQCTAEAVTAVTEAVKNAPNVENMLVEFITQSTAAMKAGGEWVGIQIPDIIQQLLVFRAVESGLWLSMCVCAIYLMVSKFRADMKNKPGKGKCNSVYDESESIAAWTMMYLVIVFPIMGAIGNGAEFLKIVLVPKLYLLEYAATLIK